MGECTKDEICFTKVDVSPTGTTAYRRGCQRKELLPGIIPFRKCPDQLRQRDNEFIKACFCDTDLCNGGELTPTEPTKKCERYKECQTSNDCGEEGYCAQDCINDGGIKCTYRCYCNF